MLKTIQERKSGDTLDRNHGADHVRRMREYNVTSRRLNREGLKLKGL